MKNRILLVEDTEKMAKTIQEFLSMSGYELVHARDGKEALELFEEQGGTLDLILLDLMIPVIGGYEVLREIRKKADIPVIIISARSDVADQMAGFTVGADDYLVKPFSLKLMKLHIEAVLKRAGKFSETVQDGELVIDIQAHTAVCGTEQLSLTRKEYDLLLYLVRHKGIVMERSLIIDQIWGYDYIGELRTVDTIVKQLRKKLPPEYDRIQTVYGVGYVWKDTK